MEPSGETCAQVITALCLGLDANRVAVLVVRPDSRHTIVVSRPTMHSAEVAPALVDVASKTRRTVQRVAGGTTIAVAPIMVSGEVPWVLAVQRDDDDGFSAEEVRVIEALAGQINAAPTAVRRLRRDTIVDAFGLDDASSVVWGETEVSEVGDLNDFDGVLVAFNEMNPRAPFTLARLQELFAQTVEDVAAVAQAHVAAVIQVDGTVFAPVAVGVTSNAPAVSAEDLISKTVVEQVLWTGEPVVTVDARQGDIGLSSQSIQGLEITMAMCMPVVVDDTTVGALYTARFSIGAGFDESTRDQLIAKAAGLAPALDALAPERD